MQDRSPDAEEILATHVASLPPGATVDIEMLAARHPEHASVLRELADDWNALVELGRPTCTPSPSGPASRLDELRERLASDTPRYRTIREVGRGGMGEVFEVRDRVLDRSVALKRIRGARSDSSGGERARTLGRFLDEAHVTGRLEHPGVVSIHDVGIDEAGCVYFTMDLVRGETLDEVLRRVDAGEDGWTVARALGVLTRVCEVVASAHERGVVHRDLKPANVMVGSFGEVYVMDWGLARVLGEADRRDVRLDADALGDEAGVDSALRTMDGDVVGTPAYMAPEQARGELDAIDARSDVYSLGAILYHLLAADLPYAAGGGTTDARAVLRSVLAGPPLPLGRVARGAAPELVAICEKAMARDPEGRYADTGALHRDLASFLEGRVVAAHETGPWIELRKWVLRNRGLASAIAALFVALAVGVVVSNSFFRTAETQRGLAEDALAESRWASYRAGIQAALSSIESGDLPAARKALDACPEEHRGWEWNFASLAAEPALDVIDAHDFEATALAVSADGTRAVTTSFFDRLVRVWDLATGVVTAELDLRTQGGTQLRPRCIAADPELARVWIAGDGPDLCEWSVETSEIFVHHDDRDGPTRTRSIALAPDRRSFATGGLDGWLRVWTAGETTPRERLRSSDRKRDIASVAFSLDGLRVFAAASDHIEEWDLTTRNHRSLESVAHTTVVRPHPDGLHLVGGTLHGDLAVWDLASGRCTELVSGHAGSIRSLAYLADGRITSAADDNALRVWSPDLEYSRELLGHGGGVKVVATIAAAGRETLISAGGDGQVRTWDPETRPAVTELCVAPSVAPHDGSVYALDFSPAGDLLVSSSREGRTVRAWNVANGRLRYSIHGQFQSATATERFLVLPRQWGGSSTTLLHDLDTGSSLGYVPVTCIRAIPVPGRADTVLLQKWGGEVLHIADLAEGTREKIPLHEDAAWGIAISPDRRTIAKGRGHWNGSVAVIDVESGAVRESDGHASSVRSLVFVADGARFVTASMDGTLGVWDTDSLEMLGVLRGHQNEVRDVAALPDGVHVVSACDDGTVRLWNTQRMEEVAAPRPPGGRAVQRVAVSPDGRRIACGDISGRVFLYETDKPELRERWQTEGLAQRVGPRVAAAFERHLLADSVHEELSRDATLDDQERAFALATTRGLGNASASELDARAWMAVHTRSPKPAMESAVRVAEAGLRLDPSNASLSHTLSLALYRTGAFERALRSLEHTEALWRAQNNEGEPHHVAVIEAGCRLQMGDEARARQLIEGLSALGNELSSHDRRLLGEIVEDWESLE